MKVLGIPPNELATRQAVASDFDFAWELYASNVRPLILPLMERPWIDEGEKQRFSKIWAVTNSQIVLFDGAEIGWFTLTDGENCIVIEQFYLKKSHQGKGIGRILVGFVTGAAAKTRRSVVAETLIGSTANTFFKKAGFSELGDAGITKQLEWKLNHERRQ